MEKQNNSTAIILESWKSEKNRRLLKMLFSWEKSTKILHPVTHFYIILKWNGSFFFYHFTKQNFFATFYEHFSNIFTSVIQIKMHKRGQKISNILQGIKVFNTLFCCKRNRLINKSIINISKFSKICLIIK